MNSHYTISNIKRVPWVLLEETQPIHLFPVLHPGWTAIIKNVGKILGRYQQNILSLHIRDRGLIFIDANEWDRLGRYGVRKLVQRPAWGKGLNRKIIAYADRLTRFSRRNIFMNDLPSCSADQLLELYLTYLRLLTELYEYSDVVIFMDLYKPHLTTYLVDYLRERVNAVGYRHDAKSCFADLTVPGKFSQVQKEEIDLLRLARRIKQQGHSLLPALRARAIQRHADKYRYQGYNWEGPAFPDSFYARRLRQAIRAAETPTQAISRLKRQKQASRQIFARVARELKIDALHRRLFRVTQEFIYSKEYRKMGMVQSYFHLEPLLREIGQRVGLSLNEIRNCTLEEVRGMLTAHSKRPRDLASRMAGLAFVIIHRRLPGRIFVTRKFSILKKYLLKRMSAKGIGSFHGQTAVVGLARGRVRIINTSQGAVSLRPGEILVSHMTNPDLVPAMKRAAAIVTDIGGITSHAAIVSRELQIPCVIGTKIATRVLRNGDLVEVDADHGMIRKI